MIEFINPSLPSLVLQQVESIMTGELFDDPADDTGRVAKIPAPTKTLSYYTGDIPRSETNEAQAGIFPFVACRHWWQEEGIMQGEQHVILLGGIYTHGTIEDGHNDIIRVANGILTAVAEFDNPIGFKLEQDVAATLGLPSPGKDYFRGGLHPHPNYLFSCLLRFTDGGRYTTDYNY